MGVINGLKTVNGGVVKEIVSYDHSYNVEFLSEDYSGHKDNIAVVYFLDDGVKTSISLYRNSQGKPKFCVYKYKGDEIQHYYSKIYDPVLLPDKYIQYAKDLVRAYTIEFTYGILEFTYPKSWGNL